MIDWKRVRLLRDELGAESFGEVVDLFLEEVETEIERLAGVDTDAEENLAAALHFLKGSALNLGFSALSDMCHDMEQAAASGRLGRSELSRVGACYEASKTSFLDRLESADAA